MANSPVPKLGFVTRSFDRAIAFVSPSWGFQRKVTRQMSFSYDAAQASRTKQSHADFIEGQEDVNLDQGDLEDMRLLSRYYYQNSPLFRSMIHRRRDNIVGTGATFQSHSKDPDVADAMEAYMAEWSKSCDISGKLTFSTVQRLNRTTKDVDGDIFYIKLKSGYLQPIEAGRVRTPMGELANPLIVNGIETNKKGVIVAIHISPYRSMVEGGGVNEAVSDRVLWEHVIYNGDPDRFSQSRVAPIGASIFTLLEQTNKFIEAVVISARVAACQGLVIESPFGGGLGDDFSTSSESDSAGKTFKLQKMWPGMVHYTGKGQKISQVKPEQPGQQFPPFLNFMTRFQGAPLGLPLELSILDFSETNYSSARAAFVQAWVSMDAQRLGDNDQLLVPVTDWKLGHFFRDNPQFQDTPENRAYGWEYPPRHHVDPQKEMEAIFIAYSNSLTTLKREAAGMGQGDWKDLIDQKIREFKYTMEKCDSELGDETLWEKIIPTVQSAQPSGDTGDEDEEDAEEKSPKQEKRLKKAKKKED